MANKIQTILNQLLFAFSIATVASGAWPHSGGVDERGGHFDKRTGQYHCHRQVCIQKKQVEEATNQARREGRKFSEIYNRDLYKHWSDFDQDCMNTRHEMLASSSQTPPKLSPDGCFVSAGRWLDPFSGKTMTRASDLDIDHIVPLAWAHSHGAHSWSSSKREQFANDPENLLVVDDGLNQAKGKKWPVEWLPPNQSYHCEYLQLWRRVLHKYRLVVSDREVAMLQKISRERCGTQ